MYSLFALIDLVLGFYVYILIGSAIFSWLFAFNVVNPRNQIVSTIGNALYQLTEPVLRPIRRVIPTMGGLDLSPLVVIFGIFFIRSLMREYGLLYPI